MDSCESIPSGYFYLKLAPDNAICVYILKSTAISIDQGLCNFLLSQQILSPLYYIKHPTLRTILRIVIVGVISKLLD